MFKHRPEFNLFFALSIFLLLAPALRMNIHWGLFYFSYFLFMGLGVGIGYHRIVCHQQACHPFFRNIFVLLGSLTHVGSIKGSAVWHTQHHLYADTERDVERNLVHLFTPRLTQIQIPREQLLEVLVLYKKNSFFKSIDKYFYIYFFGIYVLFALTLGLKETFQYLVAPASLALWAHSLGGIMVHHMGYRNYPTNDQSKNNILMTPFFFGENLHNNHHQNPGQTLQQKNWYEVDILGYVLKICS